MIRRVLFLALIFIGTLGRAFSSVQDNYATDVMQLVDDLNAGRVTLDHEGIEKYLKLLKKYNYELTVEISHYRQFAKPNMNSPAEGPTISIAQQAIENGQRAEWALAVGQLQQTVHALILEGLNSNDIQTVTSSLLAIEQIRSANVHHITDAPAQTDQRLEYMEPGFALSSIKLAMNRLLSTRGQLRDEQMIILGQSIFSILENEAKNLRIPFNPTGPHRLTLSERWTNDPQFMFNLGRFALWAGWKLTDRAWARVHFGLFTKDLFRGVAAEITRSLNHQVEDEFSLGRKLREIFNPDLTFLDDDIASEIRSRMIDQASAPLNQAMIKVVQKLDSGLIQNQLTEGEGDYLFSLGMGLFSEISVLKRSPELESALADLREKFKTAKHYKDLIRHIPAPAASPLESVIQACRAQHRPKISGRPDSN